MTDDTITVKRLNDLRCILDAAAEEIFRLENEASAGMGNPAKDAEIVNDIIAKITNEAR